jgi:hypothetical protein
MALGLSAKGPCSALASENAQNLHQTRQRAQLAAIRVDQYCHACLSTHIFLYQVCDQSFNSPIEGKR